MGYGFLARDVCPACGHRGSERLVEQRFDSPHLQSALGADCAKAVLALDMSYVLDQCVRCELVFQRYVGNAELLDDLYGVWLSTPWHKALADDLGQSIFAAPFLSRDAHELICVASWFGRPPSALRTLDYGMGWGLWARVSLHLGFQSCGFDLAEERMKAAADAGVRVIDERDFEAGTFDFINTDQVFEHVSEPLALARRLSESLKPGGILKICVPNGEGMRRRIEGARESPGGGPWSLNPVAPLEHVNCFSRKSLRLLAEEAGLDVLMPSLRHQYAFLRQPGTLSLRHPALVAKSLVRPWHRYRNPSTLYVWLRKRSFSA